MIVRGQASVAQLAARARAVARPPPRLSLSEWADQRFYLSPESAASPGKWTCIPYQRGILDAFTDPAIERVSVMKSTRIGWTKLMNILEAYSMCHDPCPILVVQPTLEDARGYSKEEITPMIRDVPDVAALFPRADVANDSDQTILHKRFPGGVLSFVGANSGRGFRRVSRKIVLFDEVDAYPPSAGEEGDQIKLAIKRSEYYWDRKIGAGSTPLIAGASRIEDMFEAGDQRRYFVPCPQCGHMAPLVFRGEGGHAMKWPEGKPEEAFFACQDKGCVIEHGEKRRMVERGEWRAARPFNRHASFHVWAAYSYAPNTTWADIAKEFLAATAAGSEELRTFVNTTLGETWMERGEAPDWQRLYDRRERYEIGVVPTGAVVVTAGADVQKDRVVWEVVAWAGDKQSWSVDSGVLPGDSSGEEVWRGLDALLEREWPVADGTTARISMLAVDSGYNTNVVYNWARLKPLSRVIACKGVSTARTMIGAPSAVDVTVRGVRLARGYKVWPVGVDIAKGEFYGWLRLPTPIDAPFQSGFCHFPEYGDDYFRQITAEHLVKIVNRRGFVHYEWQVIPGRENHYLDCRVLARAAAALLGLDRFRKKPRTAATPPAVRPGIDVPPGSLVPPGMSRSNDPSAPPPPRAGDSGPAPKRTWLGGSRGGISRRGSWLRR